LPARELEFLLLAALSFDLSSVKAGIERGEFSRQYCSTPSCLKLLLLLFFQVAFALILFLGCCLSVVLSTGTRYWYCFSRLLSISGVEY